MGTKYCFNKRIGGIVILLFLFISGYLIFSGLTLKNKQKVNSRAAEPQTGKYITNGTPIKSNIYPFVGLLYEKSALKIKPKAHMFQWWEETNLNDIFLCTVSLIDPTHVLTAAHCFQNQPDYPNKITYTDYAIAFPAEDVRTPLAATTSKTGGFTVDVKSGNLNSNFIAIAAVDPNPFDSAILELASPQNLQTISYANKSVLTELSDSAFSANLKVRILGWGQVKNEQSQDFFGPKVNNSVYPTSLLYADVQVKKESISTNLNTYQTMLFQPPNTQGTQTCYGDSGGPILYWSNLQKKWYIIGIVQSTSQPIVVEDYFIITKLYACKSGAHNVFLDALGGYIQSITGTSANSGTYVGIQP